MLTDDDLTRELGAAFRTATDNLTYTGRTQPRRRLMVALPAATAAGALVAGAIGMQASGGGHAPATVPAAIKQVPQGGGHGEQPTHAVKTKLVTRKLELAGYTVRYRAEAGVTNPVLAERLDSLPADAQSVKVDRPGVQAWGGTDGPSGDNAVYLKFSGSSDYFALLSSTFSDQQLIAMFDSPTPKAVPLVSPGSH